MSLRISVIGAGITGLASALRLRAIQPDLEIVIHEGADRAGGKLYTDRVDGFLVEAGPDSFLASKRGGVTLSEDLDLGSRLVTPRPEHRGSFVLSRGRLHPIPQGFSGLVPGELGPVFRSSLLSPAGKMRVAMDLVLGPRKDDGDESLASFATRRMGAEMYERMIEPLLSGIYAGDGSQLSLAATFPQLRASELTHGGILKGAMAQRSEAEQREVGQSPRKGFLSFDGGMSSLIERAVAVARESGTRIELNASCTGIQRDRDGGYRVTIEGTAGTFEDRVDGVIVAVPAWAAQPLLTDVAPDASAALSEIEHVSNALVAVGFPESQLTRPLDGYGYVVPRAEGRDVMAMTWVSSKWANRAPEGQVLVRAFIGRAGQQAALAGDDASLVAIALRELDEVLGLRVDPRLARVYRWDKGMPQYNLGHLERVDRIELSIARTPGIEIAGNMLRGVGIPDSIVSGVTAAGNLLSDLRMAERTGSLADGAPVTSSTA
jgi:oxygen-dependent protoporphyrinogen oxidase